MKLKKLLSKLMIMIVFLMAFTTTQNIGYSYFDILEDNQQVVIQLGNWEEAAPEWDINSTYLTGETVTYNGQEYVALKDVPSGKYPTGFGYSKNFWDLVV